MRHVREHLGSGEEMKAELAHRMFYFIMNCYNVAIATVTWERTHLNFEGLPRNAEWLVCTCVLGSILDHDHLNSSSFLLFKTNQIHAIRVCMSNVFPHPMVGLYQTIINILMF